MPAVYHFIDIAPLRSGGADFSNNVEVLACIINPLSIQAVVTSRDSHPFVRHQYTERRSWQRPGEIRGLMATFSASLSTLRSAVRFSSNHASRSLIGPWVGLLKSG